MAIEHTLTTPLAAAVRKAGGQSAFGRIIGRRQSTVRTLLERGKPLPAELVLTVERELGVSRHDLRPDIYPIEQGTTPIVSGAAVAPNGKAVESAALAIAA